MDEYCILFTLSFEHSYNLQKKCQAIDVRVNQASLSIMKRRGLLFKQTRGNEWSVLGKKADLGKFSKSDIILLDLYISDPAFLMYTQWDGFNPTKLYDLTLPVKGGEINATKLIVETNRKQRIGYGFCLAELHLSALGNVNVENILQFKAKEAFWEYLFISRSNQLPQKDELQIEEEKKELIFERFDLYDFMGTTALRVKTTTQIPICECYSYTIKLSNKGAGITVYPILPYPQPGVFQSEEKNTLRQICYIK